MSTLSVTTINSANGTTDLTLKTGNTSGATLVIPANGGAISFTSISSNNISDGIGNIRELPPLTKTASYTLISSDSGKFISTNSNIVVPNSGFTAGQNISIYNNSTANITISSDTGTTMYWAGTSNTSSRTLLQKGFSTIICVATANYIISGAGLI